MKHLTAGLLLWMTCACTTPTFLGSPLGTLFGTPAEEYPSDTPTDEIQEARDWLAVLEAVEQQRFSTAYELIRSFLDAHPLSAYVRDADRVLFDIAGSLDDSVRWWRPDDVASATAWTLLLDRFPRSALAPDTLRLLAAHYEEGNHPADAAAMYERLLDEFPDSEWTALADYRGSLARLAMIEAPDQDRSVIVEARERFQHYLETRPEGPQRAEVEQGMARTADLLAQADLQVALFYDRIGNVPGSVRYFRAVAADWPGSPQAETARAALARLPDQTDRPPFLDAPLELPPRPERPARPEPAPVDPVQEAEQESMLMPAPEELWGWEAAEQWLPEEEDRWRPPSVRRVTAPLVNMIRWVLGVVPQVLGLTGQIL